MSLLYVTTICHYYVMLNTRPQGGMSNGPKSNDDEPQKLQVKMGEEYSQTVFTSLMNKPTHSVMMTVSKPQTKSSKEQSVMNNVFATVETITRFATSVHCSLNWLKTHATRLKLVITLSSRATGKGDRIGFGLCSKVRQVIDFKVPLTLFQYGVRNDGLFYPSK